MSDVEVGTVPSPAVDGGDRVLAGTDPVLTWEGVATVDSRSDGVRPWRLPHEEMDLFPGLELGARMSAGVRVSLVTDSRALAVELTTWTPDVKPLDVVVDGEGVASLDLEPGDADAGRRQRVGVTDLRSGRKTVEVWLPQFGKVIWHGLVVDGAATVEPCSRIRPRWIAYGSSITQCRQAPSPTRTWPALVAGSLGLDLRCLGFGGQAKLDPVVARHIRDTPADLISCCLGINMHAIAHERLFLPAVLGFLATVRDGHPDTPIVVMSPICSPDREQQAGHEGGMTLEEIRRAVADGVRRLVDAGDADLHLIDGLEILGPAEAGYLPDGVHPDGDGYALMAERIASRLAAYRPSA